VRIPIPELLIRLRTEAQRAPDESVEHSLRGQGASHSLSEQMAWRAFTGVFGNRTTYKLFGWAATRFRALTPSQKAWTQNHTPLKPAKKTLHQLMMEKQND
jgi:L-lactate dehydrogenase complex protein LldF